MTHQEEPWSIESGKGTLDVVLATPHIIVVATDSRVTFTNGDFRDDAKKLFKVGSNRALAIAGLVDMSLSSLPWLSMQIVPLLEWGIEKHEPFDDIYWAESLPPDDFPEELKKFWDSHFPTWWQMISGPIQTILNISSTFSLNTKLSDKELIGLLAGFTPNGEAKIERFQIRSQVGVSNWENPFVGIKQAKEKIVSSGQLIWKTAGVTRLADQVLHGENSAEVVDAAHKYDGIRKFLELRQTDRLDEISESEMIELAKDIIRATADLDEKVGREPIQLAIIKPGEDAVMQQPEFPATVSLLPLDGAWYLGANLNPDYPFSKTARGMVFTHCHVFDNEFPIQLGENHIYGSVFERAKFVYSGGKISFGPNNKLDDCTLIIEPQVDETELIPIIGLFKTVQRHPANYPLVAKTEA